MKTNYLLISAASAALVMASTLAVAAPTSVSDQALDAIAGKNNSADFTDHTSIGISSGDGTNGNVQVGFYQWEDNHSGDLSYAKGGNTANGSVSTVQQNVTGENNIFGWGAAAQVSTNIGCDCSSGGAIGDEFDSESWGTLMVGGF